jgi:hypothetical protein
VGARFAARADERLDRPVVLERQVRMPLGVDEVGIERIDAENDEGHT